MRARLSVSALAACFWLNCATALGGERPLQLALWHPVQLVGEDEGVAGLRLSIPYGKNAELRGLDLGLRIGFCEGEVTGLQLSAGANRSGDVVRGIQVAGVWNDCQDLRGIQIAGLLVNSASWTHGLQVAGFMNHGGTVTGVQIAGVLNFAVGATGLQIGLINVCGTLKGIQIGLLNLVIQPEPSGVCFFPLVNMSF